MSPNPWDRPGQQPSPATEKFKPTPQKADGIKPKKVINVGGGGGRGSDRPRGGGGGGGGRSDEPSPWLDSENEPTTDSSASFVEYLRWMRSPDHAYKDPTKVQILQMAEEDADYRERLTQLRDRTKLLAKDGISFSVQCPWRIRTGGHRGPESLLLPAFDALGMPYIPSSTLRGVARTQAIREIMAKEKVEWKEAEERVAPWFGSLKAQGGDRAGKVVFFDAYPLPNQKGGGLAVDIASNIWTWERNSLKYDTKPNPFFSLKKATFLIGLRLASSCTDAEVLQQVKQWLIKGLQAGIGSQVNTGYGEMLVAGEGRPTNEFFRIEFSLEGQLIHGIQKFKKLRQPYQRERDGNLKKDRNGNFKPDTTPKEEVRPVAFKSMLRYWFRVLALGVLPPNIVQGLEAILFGGINPKQKLGWVKFKAIETARPSETYQSQVQLNGELVLAFSPALPSEQEEVVSQLMTSLTWLMFHLGGIGQGARRPSYERSSYPNLRGSHLKAHGDQDDWILPKTIQELQQAFRKNLKIFFQRLQQVQVFYAKTERVSVVNFNINSPREIEPVNEHQWAEALDKNCKIIIVLGDTNSKKPYALDALHQDFHQLEKNGKNIEAKSLCGGVKKDFPEIYGKKIKREATPSPIWITDLGDYQIVTVFGANQNPRQNYLKNLRRNTDRQNYLPIWPLS